MGPCQVCLQYGCSFQTGMLISANMGLDKLSALRTACGLELVKVSGCWQEHGSVSSLSRSLPSHS